MFLSINLPDMEYCIEEGKELLLMKCEAKKFLLEHSLATISKWESKFHKSFISTKNKSPEEMEYYVRCMVVKPVYDTPDEIESIYVRRIVNEGDNFKRISNFLEDRMSGTYLREDPNKPKNNETITSELIYYWLIKMEMPVEILEHWHLNRMLTLIEVFSRKDAPKKHRSTASIMRDNNALNEARRKALNTRG